MPSSASTQDSPASSVLERTLAVAAVTFVAAALVGFIVTLAGIALQESWPWLSEGIWPFAFLVPVIALPAGFVCVLGLLATSMLRKSRR